MQCSKGQGQNTTPGGQASNAQLCHLLGPQGPMLDSPHTANRDGKREPSENRTQNVPRTDAVTFLGPELSYRKWPGKFNACAKEEKTWKLVKN